MSLIINPFDYLTYMQLRQDNILQDITPKDMPLEKGLIGVYCGDGDQLTDVIKHTLSMFAQNNVPPRPHIIALNGGPLLIHPKSPVHNGTVMDNIVESERMKAIDTVVLQIHIPCGKAAKYDISLPQAMQLTIAAKEYVKGMYGYKVLCLLHVDRTSLAGPNALEGKRTYFFSAKKAAEWLRDHEHKAPATKSRPAKPLMKLVPPGGA